MKNKCVYCSKECKNGNSLRNHERTCKSNPDRQLTYVEKLSVEEKKVFYGNRKKSNQFIKAKEEGKPVPKGTMTGKKPWSHGKSLSEETKARISETRKKRFRNGTLSGRDRYSYFKDNPEKKVTFYVSVFTKGNESFIKVGITEFTFEERYARGYDEFDRNLVFSVVLNGIDAVCLERNVLGKFRKKNKYDPLILTEKFSGHTECMTTHVLDDILEYTRLVLGDG